MHLLENVIQEYAWGSRTALAELLGAPSPSPGPQAELWMGAHPLAPSQLLTADGKRSLLEHISGAPVAVLGEGLASRFEGRLPFLLKVLAAQTPLSLQAHPSLAQAKEGFLRENAAGVPLGAPSRNYKDANHKPELLCALGPFEALCGFRPIERTLSLFDALAVPSLAPVTSSLRQQPDARGLKVAFEWLLSLDEGSREALLGEVAPRCRERRDAGAAFAAECGWSVRLGQLYPGDVGAVVALMLNLLRLAPGEAIYLPAGNLHAYLSGVGVELMANSDNVLRGGLTPKHVDVPELLRVLDFRDLQIEPLQGTSVGPHEVDYATPAPEFRLSRLTLVGGDVARPSRRGPEILLCTSGAATLEGTRASLRLSKGQSAFVGADEPPYRLAGAATVYRATAGVQG